MTQISIIFFWAQINEPARHTTAEMNTYYFIYDYSPRQLRKRQMRMKKKKLIKTKTATTAGVEHFLFIYS